MILKVVSVGESEREMIIMYSGVITANKITKNLPPEDLFKILRRKTEKIWHYEFVEYIMDYYKC